VIVRLRLMNSLQVGSTITVAKSPFVIGRHAECDLKINSPRVSVFHCSLIAAEGVVLVKDMDSTNGTRVNGEPVTEPRELRHADVIWVGPALIEVTVEDGEIEDPHASSYSMTNPYLKLSDLQ
jgi:pSer/pThr/pTyr-binding forkhead associated (FHA) protein